MGGYSVQVLRLVHYLVKFGYYGELEDIKSLLGPMLSLLDGRNDKPYPDKASKLPSHNFNTKTTPLVIGILIVKMKWSWDHLIIFIIVILRR